MDKWNKLVIRLLEGRTELTGDAIFEFCNGLRAEWEKEQAELRETWEREKQEENERHAKLILGEDRYNNSPCQAHPFELIAEFVKELQQANPLTNSYIQPVPDKCDRIIWKGRYYHLPIESRAEIEKQVREQIVKDLRSSAFLHCDVNKEHVLICIKHGKTLVESMELEHANKPSAPNLEQASEPCENCFGTGSGYDEHPCKFCEQGKFFSYSTDGGFDLHDTAEDARQQAQDAIDLYHEQASEGWPEEVDSVCWGEVRQRATEVDTTAQTGTESCDYRLIASEQGKVERDTVRYKFLRRDGESGVESMNEQWNWLTGRKLSLGEVVDVFGESATVRHGDDEARILLSELLEEDYKSQDRYVKDLNEAWDTGDGSYRP